MDIQTMLSKIYDSGLNDYQIAKAISTDSDVVTQPTVNRWRHGITENPSYSRFIRVHDLYKKIIKTA